MGQLVGKELEVQVGLLMPASMHLSSTLMGHASAFTLHVPREASSSSLHLMGMSALCDSLGSDGWSTSWLKEDILINFLGKMLPLAWPLA